MPTAADSPAVPGAKPEDEGSPSTSDCEGAADDYASAFHHAPVGTLLMAVDGRPLRANRAFCELTGHSEHDIVAAGALPLHAEDRATDLRERGRCLAGAPAAFRHEVRYRRGNGELIWVDQSCTLVRGHGGEAVHFIVQAQDIAGRKRAEQLQVYPLAEGVAEYERDAAEQVLPRQLLQLNAQLEARVKERTMQLEIANRELEAFSYAISHELRAPLSAIHGFGDCLQRLPGLGLDERGRHYLQRILAGVHHMRELTDGLLSLASLSHASLRDKPVDLSALAQAAVAACRERAPQRRADVAIAPGLVVRGDPRLLAHVIDNLVGNAWKFTSRVPCARIEVGRLDGSPAKYFVRDNGAGFDDAWAGKLFEPFQRLHTQEEFEGTGIGLAIVRKVVLLHGGRVWAESVAGEGATFFFTLG